MVKHGKTVLRMGFALIIIYALTSDAHSESAWWRRFFTDLVAMWGWFLFVTLVALGELVWKELRKGRKPTA